MMVFATLLVVLAAGYAGIMFGLGHGFRRIVRRPAPRGPAAIPRVSILVPARDEEDAVEACLSSIFENDYPADRFEVILIDDCSSDATVSIVRQMQERINRANERIRLRLVRIGAEEERRRAHKKYAIEKALKSAGGEIILTTDADCVVPRGWIRTMVAHFGPATGLVAGPVRYRYDRSFLSRMQSLEFAGLVALGAGAIGLGRTSTCNAANLAYRRAAFDDVGGYEGLDHLSSGDDDLLLYRIGSHPRWDVRFCADRSAIVETDPAPDYRAYFAQHSRWASKGRHYPQTWLLAVNIWIFTFFAALVAAVGAALALPSLWPAVGAALALKVLGEAYVLSAAVRQFQRRRLLAYLLPGQLVQLPHLIAVTIAGSILGYTWKGRRLDQ